MKLFPFRLTPLLVAGLLCVALACPAQGQLLSFSQDATYTGSINAPGNNATMVVNNGAHLLFDGSWNNGYSGAKTTWQLSGGARVTLGPNAWINNNMTDMVNARTFAITGWGNEVVDFSPGFRADHTGFQPHMAANCAAYIAHYGGDGSWANRALTTINLSGVTMYTRHSQNLATANKLGNQDGALVHTDHGLIVFDAPTNGPTRWVVTDTDQEYPGGILWSGNWTLETQTNLTYTGIFAERHKVTFGSRGNAVATVTKTGPGELNLNGTQAYAPGTTLRIEQGAVNINFDPSWLDPGYTRWNWPESQATQNNGRNLILSVQPDGELNFNVPSGIQALHSSGTTGILLGADNAGTSPFVIVRQGLVQAGILQIHSDGTLDVGTYNVFQAASFSGNFHLALPLGHEGSYNPTNGVLTITAIPEPATLALLSLAALAATLRRRRRLA